MYNIYIFSIYIYSTVDVTVPSDAVACSTCRGTSLIKNCLLLEPYSRPLPRALQKSVRGAASHERGTPVMAASRW